MARIDEALPIRYHGTVVFLGVARGIRAIGPLAEESCAPVPLFG
jgi:hypothetical protein